MQQKAPVDRLEGPYVPRRQDRPAPWIRSRTTIASCPPSVWSRPCALPPKLTFFLFYVIKHLLFMTAEALPTMGFPIDITANRTSPAFPADAGGPAARRTGLASFGHFFRRGGTGGGTGITGM